MAACSLRFTMDMAFALLLLLGILHSSRSTCNGSRSVSGPLDIYWVNLEQSTDRRLFMLKQLSFYGMENNIRLNALTPDQVFVPDDLKFPEDCVSFVNRSIPNFPRLHDQTDNTSFKMNAMILSNCGRKKNSLREMVVTITHLNAIRTAIKDTNSSKPYALILEDDLQIAYEINFDELIQSAPSNFSVLQLVTSNDFSVLNLWRVYRRHKLNWVRRKQHDDYWCAGAYIINKKALEPFINGLITQLSSTWYGVHLIAGYEKPSCTPRICCHHNSRKINTYQTPCVLSARGYSADNFIYSIDIENTYMLTVPMVTGGSYGNKSTLHQDHVNFHARAFNRINGLINEMNTGQAPLPKFFNKNCMFNRTSYSR